MSYQSVPDPPPEGIPMQQIGASYGTTHVTNAPIGVSEDDSDYSDNEEERPPPRKLVKAVNLNEKEKQVREGLRTGSLLMVGLVALGFLLVYLSFILVPLVFARFLVYIFQPFINLLVGKKRWPLFKCRMRLPRWLAIIVTLMVLIAAIALVVLLITISVKQLLKESPAYVEEITLFYNNTIEMLEDYGYNTEQLSEMIPFSEIATILFDFVGSFVGFLPDAFLVLMFTLYMLVDYDHKEKKSKLRMQIDNNIRTYIAIKFVISLLVGGLTFVILYPLQCPMAILFALLAFLFNFIPNIGPLIAVVLPLPFMLVNPHAAWWQFILVFLLPLTMHMLVGNVVEPKIVGKSMEIPAITVLVSLMFWGLVWGIVGAFLAVPLTVAIQIVTSRMEHPAPQFIAGVISGDFSFLKEKGDDEAEEDDLHVLEVTALK